MKILLLGADGQVGWELQRTLAPLGLVLACNRQRADLGQPEQLQILIAKLQPQVIVNAAAYTAVDKAESESSIARQVNAEAVTALAEAAGQCGALLVHYSTDYVFDGSKQTPYTEIDPTAPLSVYGATKLEGEQRIRASGCRHLILRTSWVYSAKGNNFAKTMLRLAAERDELRVVADQIGVPTSAALIADVTAIMIYRLQHDRALADKANGIYHLVAGGEVSWHGYARFIVETASSLGVLLRVGSDKIVGIGSADYPTPAMRPLNSRLDTTKLRTLFGVQLPHWQQHAGRMLLEIAPQLAGARGDF